MAVAHALVARFGFCPRCGDIGKVLDKVIHTLNIHVMPRQYELALVDFINYLLDHFRPTNSNIMLLLIPLGLRLCGRSCIITRIHIICDAILDAFLSQIIESGDVGASISYYLCDMSFIPHDELDDLWYMLAWVGRRRCETVNQSMLFILDDAP